MIRPGLGTELKSLFAGNTAVSAAGTAVATTDYHGVAYIVTNPAVTTDTDTSTSPTAIVTIQTATIADTGWGTITTLKTFTTVTTAVATLESYELDLDKSLGNIRAYVTLAETAVTTAPMSVTALFPDRGY